ncbi:MAG: ferredoxin/flavodoxin---NADP+ reductase [Gaiellaceae bacterium]|nr:ferredoxin/flavodoxin---NADP+ reductase [Gaiellaceae bacterium]
MSAPLRVAVVGSGPAGFYAAGALLDADIPVEVDMIERLPTPWGLVRLGVAPDHPKLKTVSRAFERIAQKPGFRFFGNVEVGRDLAHGDLAQLYDAVVYAFGAQADRRLGIPGEDLPGSWSATEFVAWYNGHPDSQQLEFDLNVERAVVIGNGNVALDVARMLALTPEELAPTDTTDPAIDAIGASTISEIVVLGRRGPAQASWTTQELKELGELAGADVLVDPAELELDPVSEAALEHDTSSQRNMEVLKGFAAREPSGKPVTVRLRFLTSPVAIHGDDGVASIELVQNRLEEQDGRVVAVPTGEHETLECGLVFRSVGYRGVGLPELPFDERRGTIRNDSGRVVNDDGAHVTGAYCAGWIKRGPTGIIGTNKKDATETVAQLLDDVHAGRVTHREEVTADGIEALLTERDAQAVMYPGWTSIDELERAAGEKLGRPRVKLRTWEELLEAAERVAAAQ